MLHKLALLEILGVINGNANFKKKGEFKDLKGDINQIEKNGSGNNEKKYKFLSG